MNATFREIVNDYIKQLGCTIKDLADASGLSASTISRYCSGERTPSEFSEHLEKLADGIIRLASTKNFSKSDISREEIMENLKATLHSDFDPSGFASRFDFIITQLGINVSSMAKELNYDASFLSRIRTGNRMPSDIVAFSRKFTDYLADNYPQDSLLKLIKDSSDLDLSEKSPAEELKKGIRLFLLDTSSPLPDMSSQFLHKLNDFDLNEYIRSIHFNDLKVPSVPFQFHTSKTYFGTEGQKKGALDFIKGTVLSKSDETVFFSSDIAMSDMENDIEFSKKWMLGLAMILKRNMKLIVIHNLNRPWNELMLGLEAWIPLYMTGQVMPYYLKGIENDFYQHILCTSGTFAFSGECIKGYSDKAKYTLTNAKEDVDYYKDRSANILEEAQPLMEIYTRTDDKNYLNFLQSFETAGQNRHYILSSLPNLAVPKDMLARILKRENADSNHINAILKKAEENTRNMASLLRDNTLLLEIPDISEEEFAQHPLSLDLAFDHALNHDAPSAILYNYDEYLAHIDALKQFAKANKNFTLKLRKDFVFRNIQIRSLSGSLVWISKVKSPSIHFVIRHPRLCEAIENMCVPIYE